MSQLKKNEWIEILDDKINMLKITSLEEGQGDILNAFYSREIDRLDCFDSSQEIGFEHELENLFYNFQVDKHEKNGQFSLLSMSKVRITTPFIDNISFVINFDPLSKKGIGKMLSLDHNVKDLYVNIDSMSFDKVREIFEVTDFDIEHFGGRDLTPSPLRRKEMTKLIEELANAAF